MNLRLQKLMKLHRLMDAAGEGGSDAGGTGSGEGQGSGAGEGEGNQGSGEEEGAGGGEGEGDKGGGTGDGQGDKKPSEAEAALLKDVMKKKKALEAANTELAQVKEKLAAFDGLDIGKVKQMLAEAEAAELAKAEAQGDYERLKKKMAESHASETGALKQLIEAGNAESAKLRSQIADLTVGGAFSTSTLIPELTMPLGKARTLWGSHFEYQDGKVVGFDKPAGAADRAPLVDAAGTPLSFDAALKKIVDSDPDADQLYKSKVRAGAASGTRKAKVDEREDTSHLTGSARIAAGLKNIAKKNGGK